MSILEKYMAKCKMAKYRIVKCSDCTDGKDKAVEYYFIEKRYCLLFWDWLVNVKGSMYSTFSDYTSAGAALDKHIEIERNAKKAVRVYEIIEQR